MGSISDNFFYGQCVYYKSGRFHQILKSWAKKTEIKFIADYGKFNTRLCKRNACVSTFYF